MVFPILDDQAPPALLSLDNYLKLPHKHVEILDGKVQIMQGAGFLHHIIAGNLTGLISTYLRTHKIGVVLPDGATFLMFSPSKGLKDTFEPDVAYVSAQDYVPMPDPSKPYPGVPTLAIEVVSPGDDADDLDYKVQTYLDKGTREVWVVYPKTQRIYQHRRDIRPEVRLYTTSDEMMDCEALFPSFVLTLSEIFELPPWLYAQNTQPE